MKKRFNTQIAASHPIVSNHAVYGERILPGLAYIDMLLQLGRGALALDPTRVSLNRVTIHHPLVVGDGGAALCIRFESAEQGYSITVEGAEAGADGGTSPQKLYVTALLAEGSGEMLLHVPVEEWKRKAERRTELGAVYSNARERGLVHQGVMKASGAVYETERAYLIETRLNGDDQELSRTMLFHPALIDSAAVAMGFLDPSGDKGSLYIPLYYESFFAHAPLQPDGYAYVEKASVRKVKDIQTADIAFLDSQGRQIAFLKGLTSKLVRRAEQITASPAEAAASVSTPVRDPAPSVPALAYSSAGANLESAVCRVFGQYLQREPALIDVNVGFYELGLESSQLLSLVRELEQVTGVSLHPTLLFEYTTISELSAYLSGVAPPVHGHASLPDAAHTPAAGYKEAAAGMDAEAVQAEGRARTGDIAVIGMAGRFPAADNVQQFWANLTAGKDCITEIPGSRWDWKAYAEVVSPTGKKVSRWGGFINNPDFFDPHFFRISPREAEVMDPQERLFLEVCWEAMEDAGYTPKTLVPARGSGQRRPVGVFVGAMHKDYVMIGAEAFTKGQLFSLSLQNAPIANRVSYFCNFHGPSMAVDTLCSSSMTALHLALESIHSGESEVAIAGGVNLSLHPNKYLSYGMLDFFSSDGYCHTFGKDGDGYVPGEGVGAVILKPLSKAVQDGDSIYAVIKGSAVNHVGAVSGITVPSLTAQAELIRECLDKTEIDPRTISYVEAHGTGTSLGDPIEIEGLAKAFRHYTQDVQYCSIGSVKSNIGHAESAAGITGLIKSVLQLHHKTLVPSLHSEELNPLIEFEKTPFYVQHGTEHWKLPETAIQDSPVQAPRRAAVSSFGATGSNAHVILEEYVPRQKPYGRLADWEGRPAMVPLSAKSREQLVEYAGRLLGHLKRSAGRAAEASADQPENPTLRTELGSKLSALIAQVVQVEEAAVETSQEWSEFGIDLVQLAQIKDRLYEEFGGPIELELDTRTSIASVTEALLQARSRPEILEAAGEASLSSPEASAPEWEAAEIDLHELAYTLQIGREAMEERLLFMVRSIPELIGKLESYLQNGASDKDCYQGQVKRNKDFIHVLTKDDDSLEMVRKWICKGKLDAVADLWVKGYQLDWNLLYAEGKPSRIHLPTYPFARERYWIAAETKPIPHRFASGAAAAAHLHPLLHRNTSDLSEQRYSTVFTGEEFFLSDHIVNGKALLPGVAHLEMARSALELATGGEPAGDRRVWRLGSVVWIRPLVVEDPSQEVHIRLEPEEHGEIAYEIYSISGGDEIVYSQGKAAPVPAVKGGAVDLERLKAACGSGLLTAEQCYRTFSGMGMEYGPGQRGIQAVYTGGNQALARISLPSHLHAAKGGFVLHPSILDSALQATIGVTYSAGTAPDALKPTLPFALQEIVIYAPCPAEAWVHLRLAEGVRAGDAVQKFDIDLCDEQGEIFASIKGFTMRVLDAASRPGGELKKAAAAQAVHQPPVGSVTLYPVWQVIPDPKGPQQPASHEQMVIIGGSEPSISAIRRIYPHAHAVSFGADDDIASIAGKLGSLPSIGHIVWIAPDSSAALTDDAIILEQEGGFYQLFRVIKAMLALGCGKKKLDWSVWTVRSQAVRPTDAVFAAHAGIHGLLGSLAKEYSNWSIRAADLEDAQHIPADELFLLPADRQGGAWAYRDRQWHRQQLIQLDCPSFNRTEYRDGGVYVVIGGAGSVGEMWSEYMIRQYQAHIIWLGRRKPDAAIRAKLDRLGALGPAPRYISADAGSYESLRQAYEEIKQAYPRIHGIVHSTMALLDQSLERMEERELRSVLSAKVDTSVRMAQVFGQEALDFVLFFSSLMAFNNAPNQSGYAAGCTFEDAFARQLSQAWPCKVKTVNWGYWGNSDGGANDSETHQALAETFKRLEQIGIGLIQPEEAMEAIEKLLAGPVDQMGFMRTTKPIFIEGVNPDEKAFINEQGQLLRQPVRPNAASLPAAERQSAHTQDQGNTTGQLRGKTTAYLKRLVAETLKLPVQKLDADEPLEAYGIDSIIIVQLTNALREAVGEVPSTLFFECRTIDELAEYLIRSQPGELNRLFGAGDSGSGSAVEASPQQLPEAPSAAVRKSRRFTQSAEPGRTAAPPAGSAVQDVAVVGLAGRYPQADNVNEFWDNLAAGRNCITEIPEDRWDWKEYYDSERGKEGAIYTKWGGFLNRIDTFDPLFFHITPRDARIMDPQERLFLEVAYASIEDAGYTPATLSASGRVGVFVGAMNSNYPSGTAYWSIANRVSYCLNFRGPSMAVDTACSSSLTALHLALESIYSGSSEIAVAGGVNLIVDPFHYIRLTSQNMLSPGKLCNAFGDQADGFVDSEGVGAVVLKPLQKAMEDRDHIYGVIKGSMINSGGKTNGYTVPNPGAQSQVVSEALQRAGVHARTVSYVEAHGTGTALGDPIEVEGLRQAYRQQTPDTQYCAIGSVKSNNGHSESAAGIMGLTKVLLQLKHGYLAPTLFSEALNPRIAFANTPFAVQQELAPWVRPVVEIDGQTREYPRIAGLSSFGAGGSNAHVIIQEYIPEPLHSPAAAGAALPVLMVLSAKTEDQLREQAEQLLAALRSGAYSEADLAGMAYTLQVGREAMEERLGLIVESMKELEEKLQGYLGGREDMEHVFRGQVKRNKETLQYFTTDEDLMEVVDKWVAGRKYARLVDLWVKGLPVDWNKLYQSGKPQRISLPTYPFAKGKYWIAAGEWKASGGRSAANAHGVRPQLLQQDGVPAGLLAGPAKRWERGGTARNCWNYVLWKQ